MEFGEYGLNAETCRLRGGGKMGEILPKECSKSSMILEESKCELKDEDIMDLCLGAINERTCVRF